MQALTKPSWLHAMTSKSRPDNATQHAGRATRGTVRTSQWSPSIQCAMRSWTRLPTFNILSNKLRDSGNNCLDARRLAGLFWAPW